MKLLVEVTYPLHTAGVVFSRFWSLRGEPWSTDSPMCQSSLAYRKHGRLNSTDKKILVCDFPSTILDFCIRSF